MDSAAAVLVAVALIVVAVGASLIFLLGRSERRAIRWSGFGITLVIKPCGAQCPALTEE